MVTVWSPAAPRLLDRGEAARGKRHHLCPPGKSWAGGNCSSFLFPTPRAPWTPPSAHLSSEKLPGSQPAEAQGQATTMTISNREKQGGWGENPRRWWQVERQSVNPQSCLFTAVASLMAAAAVTAGKVLSTDQHSVPEGWWESPRWQKVPVAACNRQQKEKGKQFSQQTSRSSSAEHNTGVAGLVGSIPGSGSHGCLLALITSHSQTHWFQTTFRVQSAETKWLGLKAINKQVILN